MPQFVMVVVVVAITEPSIRAIALTIGTMTWPDIARLVRAEVVSIRHRDYVAAAEALGYNPLRILATQVLPNALPPVIVAGAMIFATAILMKSALAFLGLGDGNAVSWGSMIGDGREFFRTSWYMSSIPGLAIAVTVLALNFVADALNDALNPRSGGGQLQ